jgi:hypothetical protein
MIVTFVRGVRREGGPAGADTLSSQQSRQLLLPFEEDQLCIVRFNFSPYCGDSGERRRGPIWREGRMLYSDFSGRGASA